MRLAATVVLCGFLIYGQYLQQIQGGTMDQAKICQVGNKPTLYVDGQPTAPVLYALSDFPGAAGRMNET